MTIISLFSNYSPYYILHLLQAEARLTEHPLYSRNCNVYHFGGNPCTTFSRMYTTSTLLMGFAGLPFSSKTAPLNYKKNFPLAWACQLVLAYRFKRYAKTP